ncbi:MAG: hypothetical protein V1721_04880 [Pseudomonadota bacterium]
MRHHIGNITTSGDRKINEDPEREKMRTKLVKKHMTENAEKEARSHSEEISGERDIARVIQNLFDEQGRPPPYITVESIIRQYEELLIQRAWTLVIFKEFHRKLESLDPLQYQKDKEEREKTEKEEEIKKQEAFHRPSASQPEHPKLRDMVLKVLKKGLRAKELGARLKRGGADVRIIGVRQIETALHNLFAGYKKSQVAVANYEVIRSEADWLEVVISDIDHKLMSLKEFVDSGQTFLQKEYWEKTTW